MVNSILVGKHIFSLLSENEAIKGYVGDKIYPLIAENSATYPFIIYYRGTISNTTIKEAFANDNVTYSITVVSNKYVESLEIANLVRSTLEFKGLQFDDMNIRNSHLTNITETYYEGAYIQVMTFTATIY